MRFQFVKRQMSVSYRHRSSFPTETPTMGIPALQTRSIQSWSKVGGPARDSLLRSCIKNNRIRPLPRQEVPKLQAQRVQRRGYNIITTASSKASNEQTKCPMGDATNSDSDTNSEAYCKEMQEELDTLLATTYKKAKQISELAMTKRKRKQETAASSQHDNANSVGSPENSLEVSTNKECGSSMQLGITVPNEDIAIVSEDADGSATFTVPESIVNKKIKEREVQLGIQDEANAVEALLSMTSHPQFHKALSLSKHKQKDATVGTAEPEADVSVCLHSAFIAVTNWICSTLSSLPAIEEKENDTAFTFSFTTLNEDMDLLGNDISGKESRLLTYLLQLADRSHELELPMTIPQCQTIASLIARHSSGIGSGADVSMLILHFSATVAKIHGEQADNFDATDEGGTTTSNQSVLQADFFSGALKELLERNLLREMVEVIYGMKNQHNIHNVDLKTGIEMLNLLKMKIDGSISSRNSSSSASLGFDETDAMELAMMLQRPIMEELQSKRRELEGYDDHDDVDDAMGALGVEEYDGDEMDADDDEWWDEEATSFDANADFDKNGEIISAHSAVDTEELYFEYDGIDRDREELNALVKRLATSEGDESIKEAARIAAKSILDKMKTGKESKPSKAIHENNAAEIANPNNDTKSDSTPLGLSARFHVDPSTGEVENIELILIPKPSSKDSPLDDRKDLIEMHEEMPNAGLYWRDDQLILPDLVPQWQKLNGDRGILFTKEFESELVADNIMDGENVFDEKISNDNGEDNDKNN